MKERQKEYSLRCNLKSISSTAEAGKVHLQCCPPPLPLEKGKDGSWWLLSLRGRFLPYLRAYNYKNRFTTLSVEEKPDVPTSGESGSPKPRACKTARKNWWAIVMGDSLLQGKRGTQNFGLTCWLKKFSACWRPTSRILWKLHCSWPWLLPRTLNPHGSKL